MNQLCSGSRYKTVNTIVTENSVILLFYSFFIYIISPIFSVEYLWFIRFIYVCVCLVQVWFMGENSHISVEFDNVSSYVSPY